jgi:hypothetical protein
MYFKYCMQAKHPMTPRARVSGIARAYPIVLTVAIKSFILILHDAKLVFDTVISCVSFSPIGMIHDGDVPSPSLFQPVALPGNLQIKRQIERDQGTAVTFFFDFGS